MTSRFFSMFFVVQLFAFSLPASAIALSVATWNVEQGSVESLTRREQQLARLGGELRKQNGGALPDVLILNEVTSYASAVYVAEKLGFSAATVATSDSGNDRELWPIALEVALVTTQKIKSVTSHQANANFKFPPFIASVGSGAVSFGEVKKLVIPSVDGIKPDEFVPRAILRIELEGDTVIYAVHLNSSGLSFCRLGDALSGAAELKKRAEGLGLDAQATAVQAAMDSVKSAIGNAKKPGVEDTRQEALKRARSREAAAAAIAVMADADVNAGKSVFVAGDFNTPLVEPCKTGKSLSEDFEPMMGCETAIDAASCGGQDGFDDTYAILSEGLVASLRFKVLTASIGRTYKNRRYVDSPIDNILVAGPMSKSNFSAVKLQDAEPGNPFGSDHFPVLVRD